MESIKDDLIALANAWDRSMVENDADAIGQYMADDWTIIGSDGSMGDKTTFLGLVRSGALSHDVMESDDFEVRVYGHRRSHLARCIGRTVPRASIPRDRAGVLCLCQRGRAVEVRVDAPLAPVAGRHYLSGSQPSVREPLA